MADDLLPMIYRVEAHSGQGAMGVATSSAARALIKLDEFEESGARNVIVVDVKGQTYTRKRLEEIAAEETAANPGLSILR